MPVRSSSRAAVKAEHDNGAKYYKRWQELRAKGVEAVVISKADDMDAWVAWKMYYRMQGLRTMLELMDDGRMAKTVPCRWPADFDAVDHIVDPRVKDD